MKKYLKRIGLIALYYLLPIIEIYGVIFIIGKLNLTQTVYNLAPSMFYGITDPILIGLYFLLFAKIKKQSLGKYCNFKVPKAKNIVSFAVLGFLLGMFTYSLVNTPYIQQNFNSLYGSVKYFIISGNIFALIYIVIVNSVCKEIGFRGLIYNELKTYMPVWIAIVLQAVAYASQVFFSAGIVLAVYGLIGSVLFGVVYYFNKSLLSSIITQVFCTLGMVFLDRTFLNKYFYGQSGIVLLVLSLAAITAIIVSMGLKKKKASEIQIVRKKAGFEL